MPAPPMPAMACWMSWGLMPAASICCIAFCCICFMYSCPHDPSDQSLFAVVGIPISRLRLCGCDYALHAKQNGLGLVTQGSTHTHTNARARSQTHTPGCFSASPCAAASRGSASFAPSCAPPQPGSSDPAHQDELTCASMRAPACTQRVLLLRHALVFALTSSAQGQTPASSPGPSPWSRDLAYPS